MITTNPHPISSRWFYANAENQSVGPLTFAELQKIAASGAVTLETFVIAEGGANWKPYGDVLKGMLPPPPPIPQSPPPLPKEIKKRQTSIWAIWGLIVLFLMAFPPLGAVIALLSKRINRTLKYIVVGIAFVMSIPLFIAMSRAGGSSTYMSDVELGTASPPLSEDHGLGVRDAKEQSVAHKFSCLIVGNTTLPADSPTVARIQKLVADIAEKKGLTEDQVANMTWAAIKQLQERSQTDVSAMDVLEGMHKVVLTTDNEAFDYPSMLATFIIVTLHGDETK